MRDYENTGQAIEGAKGVPSRLMRRALEVAVRAECGECGKRVDLSDRDVRKTGSQYTVFHRDCAAAGAIRLRVEAAALRTPTARAEAKKLRAALDRAKRA